MNGPEKQDFERRLQSIAQAVILALLLWIGPGRWQQEPLLL